MKQKIKDLLVLLEEKSARTPVMVITYKKDQLMLCDGLFSRPLRPFNYLTDGLTSSLKVFSSDVPKAIHDDFIRQKDSFINKCKLQIQPK